MEGFAFHVRDYFSLLPSELREELRRYNAQGYVWFRGQKSGSFKMTLLDVIFIEPGKKTIIIDRLSVDGGFPFNVNIVTKESEIIGFEGVYLRVAHRGVVEIYSHRIAACFNAHLARVALKALSSEYNKHALRVLSRHTLDGKY